MLRPVRRASMAVAALSVGAVVAGGLTSAAIAAVSPAANVNAYILDFDAADQVAPASSFVGAAGSFNNYAVGGGAEFSASSPTFTRTFVTAPTDGTGASTAFVAGTTYDTAINPDANHAGFNTFFPNGECSSSRGTLRVDDVTYDDTQNVTAMGITFAQTCDNGRTFTGEMRWNSATDVVRAVANAGSAAATQTLTVTTAAGDSFGAAAIDAPSGAFQIVNDACSNQTFAAAGTCTIGISSFALKLGAVQGLLTLPATTGQAHVQPVTVAGRNTATGGYISLRPARILDTRSGNGAPKRKVGPGQTITVQVAGRGGVAVPAGVTAVVLNLTATSSTTGGYLTAYPAGTARPGTSSINFTAGATRANLVTVVLPASGKLSIYNATGSTQIIGDVVGYYRTGATTGLTYGSFYLSTPQRYYDSRTTSGGGGPLAPSWYQWFFLDYNQAGNPTLNAHIKAVAINLTSTHGTGTGFLSTFGGNEEADIPSTSTLNFTKNVTVPNMAIVPVKQEYNSRTGRYYPTISVANMSGAATDYIIDIVGFYDDNTLLGGTRFHPLAAPVRIVDSRSGKGTTAIGANSTHTVLTPASVGGWNTWGLVTNTTAYKPTKSTYFTLSRHGLPRPTVSNLNPYAGTVVANMAMPGVGSHNDFDIYNSTGTANVIIDVAGTLEYYPAQPIGVFPNATSAATSNGLKATTPSKLTQPLSGPRIAATGTSHH